MSPNIKDILTRVLRLMLTPLRKKSRQRNGCAYAVPRQELPNETFLALVAQTLKEGHTAELWVKGYSMRPFIEFGRDKVRLRAEKEYHVGDAVLAEITPGRYVLHRIIDKEGHQVKLQGDGNLKGTETCAEDDICGKVVLYIRPRRTINADDKTLIRRIRLWRIMRPLRRPLLWIYKATV